MVRPEGRLEGPGRAAGEVERAVEVAGAQEHGGEDQGVLGGLRAVGAERLFVDLERAPGVAEGAFQVPLLAQQRSDQPRARGDAGVVPPEGLLVERQGPRGARQRAFRVPLRVQQLPQPPGEGGLVRLVLLLGRERQPLAQHLLGAGEVRHLDQRVGERGVEVVQLDRRERPLEVGHRLGEAEALHQAVALLVRLLRRARPVLELPADLALDRGRRRERALLELLLEVGELLEDLLLPLGEPVGALADLTLDDRGDPLQQEVLAAEPGELAEVAEVAVEERLQPLLVRLLALDEELADLLQVRPVLLQARVDPLEPPGVLVLGDGAAVVARGQALQQLVPLLGRRRGLLQRLRVDREPAAEDAQAGERAGERPALVPERELADVDLVAHLAARAGDLLLRQRLARRGEQEDRRQSEAGQAGGAHGAASSPARRTYSPVRRASRSRSAASSAGRFPRASIWRERPSSAWKRAPATRNCSEETAQEL